MALTGPAGARPLGPPADLVDGLSHIADRVTDGTGRLGRRVEVDPLGLLTERATLAGLSRRGRVSCGGGARLLAARDGWLALSLTRAADVELIAAWLELERSPVALDAPQTEPPGGEVWSLVATQVASRSAPDLEARGAELGLPLAALPETRPAVERAPHPFAGLPVTARSVGDASPRALAGLVVMDLSSLWAGPLCGRLLADAGAHVVKVESTGRPDGARLGPAAFFDLMNAGKASVAVDLSTPTGVADLTALLAAADVVIEGSRPRALAQLGVDAAALTASGPTVWLSLTGHGRTGSGRDRVGFGDDAAVAGSLVSWGPDASGASGPNFCADAVADPCAGLAATAAVVAALETGGRWLVDVALARVAASLAGPTLDVADQPARPAERPRPRGRARPLGADTDRVLAEIARGTGGRGS